MPSPKKRKGKRCNSLDDPPLKRPHVNNGDMIGDLSESIAYMWILMMMSVHIDAPIIIDGSNYTATLIKNNGVFYWCVYNATVGGFEYDIILIPSRQSKEIVIIDGPLNITSRADMITMNCIICEIKTRFMPSYTSQKQFRRNLQWSKMGLRFMYISIKDTPAGIAFDAYKSLANYQRQPALIWHCSYDEICDTLSTVGDTIH
jgi:hypothetical protein